MMLVSPRLVLVEFASMMGQRSTVAKIRRYFANRYNIYCNPHDPCAVEKVSVDKLQGWNIQILGGKLNLACGELRYQSRFRSEGGANLRWRILDTGRSHDDVGREERGSERILEFRFRPDREERMRERTGALVDP